MSRPRVIFRCDADEVIGAGHLMRCLALADACADLGMRPIFATAPLSANTQALLLGRGFEHRALGPLARQGEELAGFKAAALVLDRYDLPTNYLDAWSRRVQPCLQIVDDKKVLPGVTLALNQNLGGSIEDSPYLTTFCGLRYALLRKEFCGADTIDCSLPPKRCLLTLGGSDPPGHTQTLIAVLSPWIRRQKMTLVVVVGGHNPRAKELLALAEDAPWLELHHDVANMATLMATCQVAVSAAGSTLWELCAMGLPRLVVRLAPNQHPLASAAAAAKVAIDLGEVEELEPSTLLRALDDLIAGPNARQLQAALGRELVDGQGASRVAQALS